MGRVAFGRTRACLLASAAILAFPQNLQAAQTTQYTYDALGRVLSAIDSNGKKVVYSYDSAGNRTRVSNGAEFAEITPTAWSASSNAGTTGLTATNGMKDGAFEALATIHATQSTAGAWIKADLGATKTVNHIDVAPALSSAVGASPEDLNDTVVEYSVDDSKWATAATINGVTPGATRTVALGGISARYIRIRRAVTGQVALGDMRLFSAAAANSPLIAQPDSITTSGSAVTFDPRSNDQDLDGYAFTISSVEDPPHGTAVVNSGTSITYTPDAGYFGADSFLYSVADGHNGTASARVSVLVRPSTNHAPIAVDDTFVLGDRVSSAIDGVAALRPSGNDHDSDGDIITITAKTDPAHGTVTIVGGNLIEYQPTVSYVGTDSFTYTISDGRSATDVATVNLTLGNSAPVAAADSLSVSRSASVTFDPRLNDRDPNGDAITVSSVAAATKGVATLNSDQTVTYKANASATGVDTFTYLLTDARGATANGQITVSISPNAPPLARGDNISASSSSPVTFDPRLNDIDAESDPLTITGISAPAHGTVSIGSGGTAVTYSMSGGYSGADSFTYVVSDDEGGTATATVAVNSINVEYLVVGGGGAGGYSTGGGGGGGGAVRKGELQLTPSTALSATVGAGGVPNGSTSEGGSGGASNLGGGVSAAGGGGGAGGSVTAKSGGSGGGGSRNQIAGAASTSGQGSGGNGFTSQGGGGGGGAGAPGTASTATLAGAGGAGLEINFNGSSLNYAAGGGGGGDDGDPDVSPGAAGGSSAGAGTSNTGQGGSAGAAGRGGGGGGGATAGPGGSGVVMARYLGGPKATGGVITQAGGYTIHTFTANGTFTATSANTPPTANNDTLNAIPSTAVTFDPRTNDTDSTDPLIVIAASNPAHGVASVISGGAGITYTPVTGYTGSDSFTYTISDGQSGVSTATVSVNVSASNFAVDYLIVAGGGGGGAGANNAGGGGGGGGVRFGSTTVTPSSYTITIGSGGAGGSSSSKTGANGANSSAFGLTSNGGGGGAGYASGSGGSGGSGGGASYGSGQTPGSSATGQGNAGGSPSASTATGAGGGGYSAAGGNLNGGAGYTTTISSSSVVYGSGGGGGDATGPGGPGGGSGGSGAGSGSSSTGGSGAANRGGGGGGGGSWYDPETEESFTGNGGAGGSGVVIIRYSGTPKATGGTILQSGGYTIHTFTSSGTFTVN
jgi:YD repeat-containing protein